MSWYKFRQNNSGGKLRAPALYVVVEAERAEFANIIAQEFEIYFDPECEIDCSCCGSRWDEASEDDGQQIEPSLADLSPPEYRKYDTQRADAANIPLAVRISQGRMESISEAAAKEAT